jgi:hypothetical protein
MPTYLVTKRLKITRQSGDDFDVVIHIPELFPTENTSFKFGIFDKKNSNKLLIQKESPTVTTSGQTITVPFSKPETTNKYGSYVWELEAIKDGKTSTIGMGDFELVQTLIS